VTDELVAAPLQSEMFPVERPSPAEVIERALAHEPVAIYALLSGGDGSLRATHWAMNNVPGCRVAHINTGIGIEATRQFVRETCAFYGWDLTEIRAKEDCGQDYDELVLEHGFPGPAAHQLMYIQLKDRAIEELVRRSKAFGTSEKVMLLTGIQHDDSERRSGYGGREITIRNAQMWVNHMYWTDKSSVYLYLRDHQIRRNPVSVELGMSGECGCGAYADKGELAIWRRADPAFGQRIDQLQIKAAERGVHCKWEGRPPKERDDKLTADMFNPMCRNCINSERIAA
jgi:3'-phosphoadenosine 5'-phosphosulfate sulfotransferase (PAPS reductase)/FAD synthetase